MSKSAASLFFIGFGLLTATPTTAVLWAGEPVTHLVDWELWARPVVLTTELLKVAGFLTCGRRRLLHW